MYLIVYYKIIIGFKRIKGKKKAETINAQLGKAFSIVGLLRASMPQELLVNRPTLPLTFTFQRQALKCYLD